jgi:hypothetical protein
MNLPIPPPLLAAIAGIVAIQGQLQLTDLITNDRSLRSKTPWRGQNSDPLQGTRWIQGLRYNTSGKPMIWACRMDQRQFKQLLKILQLRHSLKDERIVTAAEKLGIILYILGHGATIRAMAVMLGRAIKTCYCSFNWCLEYLRDLIKH